MNKRTVFLMTGLLVMILAGAAHANRYDSFNATADCNGWSVDGAAKIGQADRPGVNILYTVTLSQNGDILDEQTGEIYVRALMDPDPFTISGSFDNLPSGSFEISGVFDLPYYDDGFVTETFSVEMSCGQATVAQRPCFWRNNPDAWPVEIVEVGGVTYTKSEARDMMRGCFRHRVIKRLFRHTLAAKLNAANGVADAPTALIAEADAFLAAHDFHQCLPRSERRAARLLKNEIREFNRDDSNKSFDDDNDNEFDDSADEMTLNEFKAMYR